MSGQKFNKGDLVEIYGKIRLYFVGESDHSFDLSLYHDCKSVEFGMSKSIEIKLIEPAKQYITVNGHKVPKPLSYGEALTEYSKLGSVFAAIATNYESDYGAFLVDTELKLEVALISNFLYKDCDDAIAMSKALLSAMPKD